MALTKLQGQLVDSTTTINASIDLGSKTDSITVPSGTTAQRPASPSVGMIRYNTTLGYFETYSSLGWTTIAIPPVITAVSPSTYSGASGSNFTINGSSFDSSSSVIFITSSGNEYVAGSVTYVSSSQLTASTPQNFTVADEPLDVKVVNSSGLSNILVNCIDCGGVPTWNTTAGSLGTCYDTMREGFTATVSASDPESQAVTYSVTSGSLPSGMTLNSTSGVISGTPSAVVSDTTSNFTVRATDTSNNTSDRSFSIIIKAPVVQTFAYTGSDQTFTMPANLTTFTAYLWGAGGGSGPAAGGAGGYTYGTITTTAGSSVVVMVGQGGIYRGANAGYSGAPYGFGGGTGTTGFGGSGGGLSGIFTGTTSVAYTENTRAILVAGGGGGGDWDRGHAGGAGGGLTGVNGTWGQGGTQSSAGGGGNSGSYMSGGRAAGGDEGGGGGGGGGYYGGGAGDGNSGYSGGGGSGYIGGRVSATVSNAQTTAGSGTTPAGTSSPYYGNSAGVGSGYNGRVVIVY